ncbi:tyrosine recombinase XerS [Metabacillus idriensis]|uniref:tyrosine recombinase XerS n=1 Tax=Metabacillus idriensis TaxID=324768 RepID=UPI00203F1617|nr:tyrosine recombinase XerS [Metabacillus idriensis]MCM3598067.1 tyrosine recombinase XerS [Metabacillus idriensis]
MATSRQHITHKQKYEDILKLMPDYVQEYVLAMEENDMSPSTLLNYLLDYEDFFNWLLTEGFSSSQTISNIPLSDLATLPLDAARAYFNKVTNEEIVVSKHEKKTREKTSVNRKKSALRSLFKYLTTQTERLEDGEPYFHRNVMQKISVSKPKETLNERSRKLTDTIFVDNDDINFLSYLKNEYEKCLSDRQRSYFLRDKERDYAIFSLFLASGIRVNELADIRLRDINFKKNRISIIRKGNKLDSIQVIPDAMNDLKEYLQIRNERYGGSIEEFEYVFLSKYKGKSSPLSVRAIQDLVRKYTKSYDKGMSPHKLRHSYATTLMDETNDITLVMDQLGHTSTSTSVLYVHNSQEKAKMAAEAMGLRRTKLKDK